MDPIPKGRELTLTEEVAEKICAELRDGTTQKSAAEFSGIHHDTFRSWLSRGRKGKEPYATFLAQVLEAKAIGKRKMLQHVKTAAEKDWKAGAWILARQDPEEFGEKHLHKHEGTIQIDMGEMFGKLIGMLPEGERDSARRTIGLPDDDDIEDVEIVGEDSEE